MPNKILQAVLATLTLSLLYYILRLPTAGLDLAFYDDGETLYHTLAILQGRVPHLQDFNHHISGYLLPFVFGAKIFGLSPSLIREVAFLNQVATGMFIFFTLRLLTTFPLALLGACLAIAAREPWILSFYNQYQINLLFAATLWLSLRTTIRPAQTISLPLACLFTGLACTIDQRAVFLAIIPIAAFFLSNQRSISFRSLLLCLVFGSFFPLLGAIYLASHGAWGNFVEQCIVFPAQYRAGSLSILAQIKLWLLMQRWVFTETPLLVVGAIAGVAGTLRQIRNNDSDGLIQSRKLLLWAALPLLIMPYFGARDFEYYSLTWNPWLAIMAVLALPLFTRPLLRKFYFILLLSPLAFSLWSSAANANWAQKNNYSGNGAAEVSEILRQRMEPGESIFVWGYRMDLYVRLEKLSPYLFANLIAVHPDGKITQALDRNAHIYPKYEELFLILLNDNPPDWVVVTKDEDEPIVDSQAKSFVFEMLRNSFTETLNFEKLDFRGKKISYSIYRRRLR